MEQKELEEDVCFDDYNLHCNVEVCSSIFLTFYLHYEQILFD